mgnify:CR=1 FL=1
MRITDKEKYLIIQYAKEIFGENNNLYLFGSRIDDAKKGGDIDLFLESDKGINMEQQVEFIAKLYRNVTTRKIDLVVKNPLAADKPIYHTAKEEGILLC